ncbi:MAG: hypothetical protein HXX13_02685 [Bacteroidetes bacterium]|nr:hypothetical protein [Bacteroidota bacterium]
MKNWLLYLIFFLIYQSLYAQTQWKNISDTRSVMTIVPDGNKIWLSSVGGLMCINKLTSDTTFYNHANSGIPFTRIISMCLDKTGRLWLVCDSKGIACLEGDSWTWYNTANTPLPNNFAVSVTVDSQNNLWFGFEFYLVKFDGTNWTSFAFPQEMTTGYLPYNIAIDANDRVLIGAEGIWAFNGSDFIQYNTSNSPLLSNNIRFIKAFQDGKIWIGHSSSGLTITDFTAWKVIDTLVPGRRLFDVSSFDGNTTTGTYWLATYPGDLYYYDGNNWSLQYASPPLDSLKYIRYLAVDENDELYVSALKSATFDGSEWHFLNTAECGFKGYNSLNVFHSKDQSTWIAGNYNINRFTNNTWTNYTSDDVSIINPYCFADDQSNNIYAGHDQGISYFENTTWHRKYIPTNPIFNNDITHLCFDKNNHLWMSAYPGLIDFDGINATYYSSWLQNFPSMQVNCLAVNSNGYIVAGTNNGLVIKVESGWVTYNMENSPIPSDVIRDIAVNENDTWIATNNGLARFDGINWDIYTKDNSLLPDNYISTVDVDSNGVVWLISYFDNLVRFDGQQWEVFQYENSGMQIGIMQCIRADKSGNIWIGSEHCGLTIYNENGISLNLPENNRIDSNEQNICLVHPNPANDEIRVSYKFPESNDKLILMITSLNGIKTGEFPLETNEGIFSYPAKELSPGLYLVTISDGNTVCASRKIQVTW